MNNNTNTILRSISCEFLGSLYEGQVSINLENGEVDLLGLCEDSGLFIRYNGHDLLSVIDALKGHALFIASASYPQLIQFYHKCRFTGYFAPAHLFYNYKTSDTSFLLCTIAFAFDGLYYYEGYCHINKFKESDGTIKEFKAPSSYWDSLCYCSSCGCFMERELFDYDKGMCFDCAHIYVIENYGVSHDNNEHPILWSYSKTRGVIHSAQDVEDFSGLGFELEVDSDDYKSNKENNEVAYNLPTDCGLNVEQVRFAHDGSLQHGFEIISQPHTISAFWACRPQWEKMLRYLSSKGYVSHNLGSCGLHIHVSRNMFGKSETEQERAIAKIFSFYNDNWNELVKASRRENFSYCDRNYCDTSLVRTSKYLKWKDASKRSCCRGHYVALNNANKNTFEFRLGRGTLKPLSFFSWVDLTLTLVKNARRITINQLETNDILSWLGGIKESTARYLYNKGSFKNEVLTLFPCIAWDYVDYE